MSGMTEGYNNSYLSAGGVLIRDKERGEQNQNKTTAQKTWFPQHLGVHWHIVKASSVKQNVTAGGNGSKRGALSTTLIW